MPDTLKAQHTAFLTAGRVLYSDMGRVLVLDRRRHLRLARHHLAAAATPRRPRAQVRRGRATRTLRNDFHRNARDNLLVELGKHGLGKRDVVAERELLRARSASTTTGALAWVAGQQPRRAPPSSCASR